MIASITTGATGLTGPRYASARRSRMGTRSGAVAVASDPPQLRETRAGRQKRTLSVWRAATGPGGNRLSARELYQSRRLNPPGPNTSIIKAPTVRRDALA
jgi:hypothetical protein